MSRTLRLLAGTGFAAALAVCALAARPGSPTGPATPVGAPAQWNLRAVHAPDAWPRTTGAGTTIAVVDSGIDLGHPDLAGRVRAGTDCIRTDGDPVLCAGTGTDSTGHGTHVAGIAAARGPGIDGVRGVAPGASLLAVRAIAGQCPATRCTARGRASDVAAGVRWSVAHGADVVNLSVEGVGAGLDDAGLASAIDEAWGHGVIVVVAAGNAQAPIGLGRLPAIVVVASDRADRVTPYDRGTGGARWGLTAPGGDRGDTDAACTPGGRPAGILSTYQGGTEPYACLAGTSMAAPHVAGAAALLRAQGYSPRETVARLLATATDLGLDGDDGDTGSGLLDVGRATAPEAGTADADTAAAVPAPPSGGGSGRLLTTLLAGAAVTVAVATVGLWSARGPRRATSPG